MRQQNQGRETAGDENSPLIGLPNVICTPHIAGSTAEAQEEVGTQVAVQIRDYLTDGIIRNAVNLPARLGSLVSQATARPERILGEILQIKAISEAKLLRFAE